MNNNFGKSIFDCQNGNNKENVDENCNPNPALQFNAQADFQKLDLQNQPMSLVNCFNGNSQSNYFNGSMSEIEHNPFEKSGFSDFKNAEFFNISHDIGHDN